MNAWKWKQVPIYYKVILANSAMALAVITTLLLWHDQTIAVAAVVVTAGVVNAILVRTALSVNALHRQQRELLAWTLDRTEAERTRVVREIHDGAAQRLAALLLQLPGDRDISSEAAAVMNDLCETARTLEPPGMRLLGLAAALRWLAGTIERRTGLAVELSIDGPLQDVDGATALGFYRVVEDILETAASQAAEHGQLSVVATASNLVLAGSIQHVFNRSEHFRLAERAALLGGVLDCSHTESETAIRLTIPYRESHVGYDSRLAG
jgi:signal transduction histidine kinase